MQGCTGAKLTAKKNKVTDRQASGVTSSLLELLVAAKNMCVRVCACVCVCMHVYVCLYVSVSVCVCV